MKYKAGYKYQLVQDEHFPLTGVLPNAPVDHDFFALDAQGNLTVKRGYAWDGPSGPTFDTKDFMRGSLAHDALYQMMGDGSLSADKWRKRADDILVEICKQDGMPAIRRAWVWAAVRAGGAGAARRGDTVETAP